MKNFYAKRLLSLIVLSLAVAAYSFAQNGIYGLPNVIRGSKEGLVYKGMAMNFSVYFDKYVIENNTEKNVAVYCFRTGSVNAYSKADFNDIVRNNKADLFTLQPNEYITFSKDNGEYGWSGFEFYVADIEEDEGGYRHKETREEKGGKRTCTITVFKKD